MSTGVIMRSQSKVFVMLALVLCFSASCMSCNKSPSQAASTAPAERNGRWAVPLEVEGLPNLFQVTPDIYRSAQPDETGMQNAKKMGIKTILSFRTSNKDPKLSEGTGLIPRRVPITTWAVEDDEIVEALRIIRLSPKPMLVHCLHGADRTGLIMAMYRMVFQGWSKEEAKDEMINGGYGYHSMWTNIPKEIDKADIEAIKAKVFAGPSPNGR